MRQPLHSVRVTATFFRGLFFFDFSGYSDMAIGLGRMLGFKFPENFNYPYKAVSIKDFWRRWHITFSNWFRDYVYIPLGGNRKGKIRTYIHQSVDRMAVDRTLAWGKYHIFDVGGGYAAWILVENFLKTEERMQKVNSRRFRTLYAGISFCIIMLLWTVFRAENIFHATAYIKTMFNIKQARENFPKTILYLLEFKCEFVMCIGLSFIRVPKWITDARIYHIGKRMVLWLVFLMSVSYLVKSSYSPFIYFNF